MPLNPLEIREQNLSTLGRTLSTEVPGASPEAVRINALRADYNTRLVAAASAGNDSRDQLALLLGSVEAAHDTEEPVVSSWVGRLIPLFQGALQTSSEVAPAADPADPAADPAVAPVDPAPATTTDGTTTSQTSSAQADSPKRSAWRIVTTPINYAVVKPIKLVINTTLYPFRLLKSGGSKFWAHLMKRSKVFG